VNTSPCDIFIKAHELKQNEVSFVLATVIAVRGSTSAKVGSKAIYNDQFKNIFGWVGGGCAESYIARQSEEALKLKSARIITVDLDDEVFGLLPCGGVMDVYLEPHFPSPVLKIPNLFHWHKPVTDFLKQIGFAIQLDDSFIPYPFLNEVINWKTAFVFIAKAIAKNFGQELKPLREIKGNRSCILPQLNISQNQLIIVGQSRIVEELCRMAKLLSWDPIVYPQLDSAEIVSLKSSFVIVASHHHQDDEFIAHALKSKADYVAFIASQKRSQLVFTDLQKADTPSLQNYFAPAGLSLPTETPGQIAFSILSEILFCQGCFME
jgi:xanthine/CO dehydrogenase XdhC/CoxF family maturation factor